MLCLHVRLYTTHLLYLQRPEEGVRWLKPVTIEGLNPSPVAGQLLGCSLTPSGTLLRLFSMGLLCSQLEYSLIAFEGCGFFGLNLFFYD